MLNYTPFNMSKISFQQEYKCRPLQPVRRGCKPEYPTWRHVPMQKRTSYTTDYAPRSVRIHISRIIRKQTISICENKDADQLRGNRESGRRLCFRNADRAILLLSKFKLPSSLLVQLVLCRTCSDTTLFPMSVWIIMILVC